MGEPLTATEVIMRQRKWDGAFAAQNAVFKDAVDRLAGLLFSSCGLKTSPQTEDMRQTAEDLS